MFSEVLFNRGREGVVEQTSSCHSRRGSKRKVCPSLVSMLLFPFLFCGVPSLRYGVCYIWYRSFPTLDNSSQRYSHYDILNISQVLLTLVKLRMKISHYMNTVDLTEKQKCKSNSFLWLESQLPNNGQMSSKYKPEH